METTLMAIEMAAKEFAASRRDLAELVTELNDEVDAARRRRMERLKRLVGIAAEKQNGLFAMVECGSHLFRQPRTLVFHGIKVGWQKAVGGLVIDDPDRTVALIEKYYMDEERERLLRISKKPDKETLERLSAVELKKLGVQVTQDGDRVVIKPMDSEVDKVVRALLKSATDDAAKDAP
jgi:hypothetical protein